MRTISKRLLCTLLCVFLLLAALPLTVNAVVTDTAATGEVTTFYVPSEDYPTLQDAKSAIDLAGAGEYVIELTADITSTGGISFSGEGIVVTIIGNGYTFTSTSGQNVQAWDGAKVILGDGESELTLIGSMSGYDNEYPGIFYIVDPPSVGIMNDKVTLKNNMTNNHLGAGVSVQSGTFIMNGGTIENCGINGGSVCYGGGVAVFNSGYFEMNNGTIKNCYVKSSGQNWLYPWVAGGGVFVCRADFTMNGGTIENCTATNYDSSSRKDAIGGGVAVITSLEEYYVNGDWGFLDSNFTMNGGTIKSCTSTIGGGALAAGMAYINVRPCCTTRYGVLSGSSNPGIYLNAGSMIGNEASAGGAIFLNWIRPAVNIKNMLIDSNNAGDGGAINVIDKYTHTQIENCTLTNNTAVANGGAIMLQDNVESVGTHIKDTIITGNTSEERGAGIFYNAGSTLTLSGANTIQNNTYNGKLNNLNIYMEDDTVYPVYVDGALTGSQIGLSDPTLWDDGKEDTAADAVSTNYLTSGYKSNNSANPGTVFTSDHETWYADFSDVNANEVRLFRKETVDYHINNTDISDETYQGVDEFTEYVDRLVHTVSIGDTIEEFYLIPQHDTNYIFKGWYYDQENDNDTRPVKFDTDKYTKGKDIYAHWIKVENVDQDEDDPNILPAEDNGQYGGFDLSGVQIRKEMRDYNFENVMKTPGGMRFVTALSMDVVNEINAIQDNNIEYGYVAATSESWIEYHRGHEKLQYVSETANGINTTATTEKDEDYFGFAHNVNCTSKVANSNGVVALDHQNYDDYLLYSLVVTYEKEGSDKDKNVLARPYIRYTDANGLERVAYSEYRGTNVLGGCYTNYNANVQ